MPRKSQPQTWKTFGFKVNPFYPIWNEINLDIEQIIIESCTIPSLPYCELVATIWPGQKFDALHLHEGGCEFIFECSRGGAIISIHLELSYMHYRQPSVQAQRTHVPLMAVRPSHLAMHRESKAGQIQPGIPSPFRPCPPCLLTCNVSARSRDRRWTSGWHRHLIGFRIGRIVRYSPRTSGAPRTSAGHSPLV